jgi:hypothetical protein
MCKDTKALEQEELQKAPEKVVVQPAAVKTAMMHYICLNNCKGSGSDVAGNCPVCGKPYTHNEDFHNQANPGASRSQVEEIRANTQAVNPAQQKPAEPPQNAKGVWHFTCPKGCEGGAGAQGKCGKCGGDLAHNQAYHAQ